MKKIKYVCMKQHKIRFYPLGKELWVNDDTPLIDVIHQYGIEFPCGGKGTCGKCKVKVLEGDIEETEFHRQKLQQLCLTSEWRLACLSKCTCNLTLEIDQFNQIILADESEFDFCPQDGYGVAVDLGTTTLVTQLVHLFSGKVIAVETMLNPQLRFGSDVISLIQHGIDGHLLEMSEMIRIAIGSMVEKMLKRQPVEIKRMVVVGNTTMQFIFCGDNIAPLSAYPFQVETDNSPKKFCASALGWQFHVEEFVYFYPFIGSFVGSDILAGIAATGLHKKEKYTALIDLGTNAEIVVGNRDRIVCASTAAGPAFEGTNISIGMRAVTGAISSVKLEGNHIKINVIGNAKAKGICGSGLIDAVAIFRQLNLIGDFGEILSGNESISLSEKVCLTQKDIYEFLLAKAAIAAGLTILSDSLSISLSDIDKIYLAGGFGNYINIDHVISTGMIDSDQEKIHKMGNTALIGAKMFLFSGVNFVHDILSKTKHIQLETNPDFQDIYVGEMMFL
jgi:uncharacterized 2Fe-2S/4Fe-4S cluster protein (DUF4445 family)